MSWREFFLACQHRRALDPLHQQLAQRTAQLSEPDHADHLFAATALTSWAVAQGHSCLELARAAEFIERTAGVAGVAPPAPFDQSDIERLVDERAITCDAAVPAPLVLRDGRLYLRRFAQYEDRLREAMQRLLNTAVPNLDPPGLHEGAPEALFETVKGMNWQALAAALAIRQPFAVISGGPGTGKTYTILRLVASLQAAHLRRGETHRVALCAPTGKAAQRVSESISMELRSPKLRAFLAAHPGLETILPREASTLHRLLGAIPGRAEPQRNTASPLAADTVIVDESSMVDLALMCRLTAALKPGARLILVGDRNQLPPVEAGSVFAELCAARGKKRNVFSPKMAADLARITGSTPPTLARPGRLGDHIVELVQTHRFNQDLAFLAASINKGAVDDSAFFFGPTKLLEIQRRDLADHLETHIKDHDWFAPLRQATTPIEALAAMRLFRVLCAVRHGPYGARRCNEAIEESLGRRYGFNPARRPYHLQPFMITVNDPIHGLYNGDVGIFFSFEDGLAACFEDQSGGLRTLAPGVLPAHDVCYAMTVHKSQGSEFDAVAVILPEADSQILSRELLYTAVTRARHHVACWAPAGAIAACVARRQMRMSGPIV